MWLVEAGGLRILFDPLLAEAHHGGVLEVVPRRTIDVAALRPDFVLITSRHPDHFDVASLRQLAAIDTGTVIVTPDPLVKACVMELGFTAIRLVLPGMHVDLDGVRLLTTPSEGSLEAEWGAMLDDGESVLWNLVDTEAPPLGSSGGAITLALVRWQPLLGSEAMLGGPTGFPFQAYAGELARAKRIGARVVVPSPAGVRHAAPFAGMNRIVYPIEEERFRADLTRMGVPSHPATIGTRFRLANDEVSLSKSEFVTVSPFAETRDFRPFEVHALVDPNVDGRDVAAMREAIATWVHDVLAAAVPPDLCHLLEVVLPGVTDVFVLEDGRTTRTFSTRWDIRCAVAGSLLLDVVEGRRSWGDVLISGCLRAVSRAYDIGPRGLRVKKVEPLFVYEGITYETSVIRSLHSMAASGKGA